MKRQAIYVSIAIAVVILAIARVANNEPVSQTFSAETPEFSYGLRISRDTGKAQVFITSKLRRPVVLDGYKNAFEINIIQPGGKTVTVPDLQVIDDVGPGDIDWVILGSYTEFTCNFALLGAEHITHGTIRLVSRQRDFTGKSAYFADKGCIRVKIPASTEWKL